MQIKISLTGNSANNQLPMVMIRINNELIYNNSVNNKTELAFDIDPAPNNVLEIEHYNKTNNNTVVDSTGKIVSDLSIELNSIEIDCTSILPTVLHSMPFYVKWPENIIQDYQSRNETPPDYITNNLYFGFNGVYKLNFVSDVKIEYYRQFWLDESQAHKNQTITDSSTELFTRFGESVAVNQDNNFTIYDLEKLVLNDK